MSLTVSLPSVRLFQLRVPCILNGYIVLGDCGTDLALGFWAEMSPARGVVTIDRLCLARQCPVVQWGVNCTTGH